MTDGYERYKIMDNPPKKSYFPRLCHRTDAGTLRYSGLFLLPSYNELFPMTILEAAWLRGSDNVEGFGSV